MQDATKCDLVLPYGEMDQKCASGLVFPYNDGLIHSRALRKDHLKVMIDNVEENFKGLPIPVMTDEVSFLEKAIGTVIQWPRIAIKLAKVHLNLLFYLREFSIWCYSTSKYHIYVVK